MLKRLSFCFFSALLLFISWPPISSFTSCIFIAFVPLLLVEWDVSNRKISQKQFFGYSYLTFFIFNLLTTYWVKHAHLGGAVFAIICNTLFMALVFSFYSKIKNNTTSNNAVFILPILWLSFEYLHLNWDLSWPWLTLGNVFATQTDWVQWYSYTGVLGGTLWVLLVNLSVLNICKKTHLNGFRLKFVISTCILLIFPLLSSYYLYGQYVYYFDTNYDSKDSLNVLVVQPNIDPYKEKFSSLQIDQTNNMLNLIRPYVTAKTDFIILPETFLNQPIWEHQLFNNLDIKQLFDLINNNKLQTKLDGEKNTLYSINILVGAMTLGLSQKSPTSKPLGNHKHQFYQVYNTALHLRNNFFHEDDIDYQSQGLKINTYHKSKLVPGAEKMPFQNLLFPLLGDQILKIGSSTSLGNFSPQDSVSLFNSTTILADSSINQLHYSIAPIICYESIYGNYVRQFVQKGAQAIFIITNDGWWKQTSGYKQHSMYAKLRAIETRCYIARSANTGISSIINPLGIIDSQIDWDNRDVISASILLNNDKTFYTKHGDFLGRISSFLSIFIFLLYLVRKKLNFSH
ncbi:MAG: apolipoprotein N-acyltransferase [Flavobacteriales bacterium]|nr:apolipoprotein N-acyltransferase [Flavobacteriales bacterium]